MNKNTILLISLFFLTACVTEHPQGARVRPMPGQPTEPVFNEGSAAKVYPLNDAAPQPLPQNNEVSFLQNQQNNPPPAFPNTTNSGAMIPPAANSGTSTPPPAAIPPAYVPPANSGTTQVASNTAPQTPPPAPTGGNAVKALLDDARKAVQENNLNKAAGSLERAVRLEPRNASIWYDLAQIRLHQNNYSAAEQMANKSISFTQNQDLIKRNRQIIEVAQRARQSGN